MDHVHIMLSIPPSRAIGYAIRVIARELLREFPELKRRLCLDNYGKMDISLERLGVE